MMRKTLLVCLCVFWHGYCSVSIQFNICILSSFDDLMQVRNTKKQTKMALIIPKSEKILI